MTPLDSFSKEDLLHFFQLWPMVLADHKPDGRGSSAMAYLFANTVDNVSSQAKRAVLLAKEGRTNCIGICEGSTANGYPGFAYYVDELRRGGLRNDFPIVPLQVHGNVNTLSEARALVAWMGLCEGDLDIITPAFHLLRAFMTIVTQVRKEGIARRVYAVVGTTLPWDEEALHSQGALRATREDLILSEFARLAEYQAPEKGGMLPPGEVIKYLRGRGHR